MERVNRLDPREVIVSSDPDGQHHLPDLTGSAIFAKFETKAGRMVALTQETGTVHLKVTSGGTRRFERYGDGEWCGFGAGCDGLFCGGSGIWREYAGRGGERHAGCVVGWFGRINWERL